MKNMKFRVQSPEHSEAIQKELFRLGFSWRNQKIVSYTEECFLYAGISGRVWHLSADSSENYFNHVSDKETTLEELKLMKP